MTIDVEQAVTFSADLFRTVTTPRYSEVLIGAFDKLIAFDVSAVVLFPGTNRPVFLFDSFARVNSQTALNAYVSGTYLLDPVYTACRNGTSGLRRLTEIMPDNYLEIDFYISTNFHPCVSDQPGSLSEEIVYIVQLGQGSSLVVSLMRMKGSARFNDDEFALLSELEPIVRESALRHCGSQAPTKSRTVHDELETAFSDFAKDRLSLREQMVVSLMLRGHSTLSVAVSLGIAEGTVKIHRKNIYEKLNISSQAQLFLLFCDHILRDRDHA